LKNLKSEDTYLAFEIEAVAIAHDLHKKGTIPFMKPKSGQ
jgi:hypothetical protein